MNDRQWHSTRVQVKHLSTSGSETNASIPEAKDTSDTIERGTTGNTGEKGKNSERTNDVISRNNGKGPTSVRLYTYI